MIIVDNVDVCKYYNSLSDKDKKNLVCDLSKVCIYITLCGRKTMKYIETYIKYIDNVPYIAVLISSGYGTGFSTETNNPEIAYDKRIIEYWLNKQDSLTEQEIVEFFVSCGYDCDILYKPLDTFNNLDIVYVPLGTGFYINNYDGAETIITEKHPHFTIANDRIVKNNE